ncbi:proton-coupled folate transporter-like [Babylonia areolata]|uniref:proton-coupled folate transporter-like n=1 Tax=Babylonia areolata TaxID=304850 RepID=UPI003FD07741
MPSASKVDDDDDERRPLLSSSSPSVAQNEVVDDGNDDDDDDSAGSSFSCRRCVSTYVPIEPLLLGYAFARVIIIVLTGFYFFDEASRWYGDPSMSSLNPCGTNQSAGGHAADQTRAENVQKEALQLTMVGSFSVYMTAVLPALFIGPLTDRIGRRLGFALPVLGVVLRGIVFLLVLGTGANVYFIYIGTVLEGLGGGFGTLLMTSFSAAADVTKPGRQRALRICIIEAVQVLGSALAGFIAGQWRRVNYTQPLMLAAAVGVLTLMFALWAMPETLSPPPPPPPQDLPLPELKTQQPQVRRKLDGRVSIRISLGAGRGTVESTLTSR